MARAPSTRALAALALAAAGACFLEEPDFEGRACSPPDHPCIPGYDCLQGICQRAPRVQLSSAASTVLAGTCADGEVSLFWATGEPARPDRDTVVALLAGGGMRLFADRACQEEAQAVTVPAGAADASFSFFALSGGPYQLAASGPVNQAVLDQQVSPLIRAGACALGEGASEVTCPVAPPVLDVRRSFAVFQATSGTNTPGDAGVRCQLTAPDAVSCDRDGEAGAAEIRWQVAEVPGASVQAASAPAGCDGGAYSFSLPAPVDPASAFLLFSERRLGVVYADDDFSTAQLIDPGTVVVQNPGGCTALGEYAIQVVELPGAAVTRGLTGRMDTGSYALLAGAPPADVSRSLLLHTHRYTGAPGSPACAKVVRGEIFDAGQLLFSRSAFNPLIACISSGEVSGIAWEQVQLPPGDRLQRLVLDVGAGSTVRRAGIAAVDPTRTLVLASGQGSGGQSHGETREANESDTSSASVLLELEGDAGVVLRATRTSDGGLARFTAYVWELNPSP